MKMIKISKVNSDESLDYICESEFEANTLLEAFKALEASFGTKNTYISQVMDDSDFPTGYFDDTQDEVAVELADKK